jgi:hypothetical protein
MDLKLASVAGAGIHLPDGEASLKAALDDLFQLDADLFDLRVGNGRQFFSDNAGSEYLFEDPDHKTPKNTSEKVTAQANILSADYADQTKN